MKKWYNVEQIKIISNRNYNFLSGGRMCGRLAAIKKQKKINLKFDKAKIESLLNDSLGFIEGVLPMEDIGKNEIK